MRAQRATAACLLCALALLLAGCIGVRSEGGSLPKWPSEALPDSVLRAGELEAGRSASERVRVRLVGAKACDGGLYAYLVLVDSDSLIDANTMDRLADRLQQMPEAMFAARVEGQERKLLFAHVTADDAQIHRQGASRVFVTIPHEYLGPLSVKPVVRATPQPHSLLTIMIRSEADLRGGRLALRSNASSAVERAFANSGTGKRPVLWDVCACEVPIE